MGDLLQRPLEQLVVVGLEVDLPALRQHLTVLFQEVAVGQPPLFLIAFRPRVAEVDVQPVDLAGSEHIRQQRRVAVHEPYVFQPRRLGLLHGHHHGIGHLLHGDEQHVRLRRRRLDGKAALAAAQLHPQRFRLRHQRAPVTPQGKGIHHPIVAAGLHSGSQVFLLPHPHRSTSQVQI